MTLPTIEMTEEYEERTGMQVGMGDLWIVARHVPTNQMVRVRCQGGRQKNKAWAVARTTLQMIVEDERRRS